MVVLLLPFSGEMGVSGEVELTGVVVGVAGIAGHRNTCDIQRERVKDREINKETHTKKGREIGAVSCERESE